MATEYPPLGKSYVISYSNNDRDYPIIGIRKDPRVDNYKIPDDLSPHPDSTRYPNHIFTGANPTNSDERVLWVYEILPSPWVPFTRYDDDLGPIQGRRRSVKNEGQIASLTANKRVTYEAREGSAIVSNEIEESWNAGSGEDDESPFPIKERDFYDDRLGAVSETRQLFAAKGDEEASLVYEAPKIIQTDYEIYNEYLVVKVVRSYVVPCPERIRDVYDPTLGSIQEVSQVILDTKDLEGSIVFNGTIGSPEGTGTIVETVYQPINTLAIERTIRTYSVPAPVRRETVYDPVKGAIQRTSQAIKDDGAASSLFISGGQATETRRQAINEVVVDAITETYAVNSAPKLEGQQYEESLDIVFPYEQQAVNAELLNFPLSRKELQPVDKAHSIQRQYDFDIIESQLDDFYWECPDLATVNLPDILLRATLFLQISQGADQSTTSGDTYYVKSSSSSSINGDLVYDVQSGYSGLVPAVRSVFFIKRNESNITNSILAKLAQNGLEATIFPYVKTINHTVTMTGGSQQVSRSESASVDYDGTGSSSQSVGVDFTVATQSMKIPPTLHPNIPIKVTTNSTLGSGSNISGYPPFSLSVSSSDETTGIRTYTYPSETTISIPATDPPTFPLGKYITSINASPYRFGYTRVETIVVDITGVYTQTAQDTSSTPAAEQSTPPAVLDRFSKIQLPSPWQAIAYVGIPFTYRMLGAGIWVQYLDVNTGTIPSWASYNESTGVLSGTPTQIGTYNISVTAFNNYGGAQIATFKLIVATQ